MITIKRGTFICTKQSWRGGIYLSCGGNAKNRRRFVRELKKKKGFLVRIFEKVGK